MTQKLGSWEQALLILSCFSLVKEGDINQWMFLPDPPGRTLSSLVGRRPNNSGSSKKSPETIPCLAGEMIPPSCKQHSLDGGRYSGAGFLCPIPGRATQCPSAGDQDPGCIQPHKVNEEQLACCTRCCDHHLQSHGHYHLCSHATPDL